MSEPLGTRLCMHGGGTVPAPPGSFRHEAVLYSGAEELVSLLAPWVEEGLALDDPVVALVTARSGDALRERLGATADRVTFADMGDAGRNPSRIISVWRSLATTHARPGHTLRAIGEPVWPGRSPDELLECRHHESLLNRAFEDDDGLWLLCPYDVGALDPEVVAEVDSSHPMVVDRGDRRASDAYHGVVDEALLRAPLPDPDVAPDEILVGPDNLTAARHAVARRAATAGLAPRRARDLVLAVSEVATNSILHGGGKGVLRMWTTPGSIVGEVRDGGHIEDALVGRRLPPPNQVGGRGLWLVNELCDLVQLRSTPEGTVVRLHMQTA